MSGADFSISPSETGFLSCASMMETFVFSGLCVVSTQLACLIATGGEFSITANSLGLLHSLVFMTLVH